MAAYAALLSLMNTIKQIQHHPRPPISLDKKHVDSLIENITCLQNFLELGYSSSGRKEEDDLQSRVADAAYAAEDVIKSHIVDQIHSHGKNISSIDFYQGMQKVIQDMDLIKKEVESIKEKMGAPDRLRRNSSISTASLRPASTAQNNIMVDFGDVLYELMDKLTEQPYNLQIIPIVGMGGIGKTTLARRTYMNPLIVEYFEIRAWITISQEYSRKEILQALCLENKWIKNDCQMSADKLGETLYKNLFGRRYLIVVDDIWSSKAWDEFKSCFPDNSNGSRIMITTRLSNLVFQLGGSHCFKMNFLNEDKSWNLLCKIVFGEKGCPSGELEKIGKEIAKACRGLPLSIVVIGGLLTKFVMTQEYWKYILKNLTSLINLENNEHCLQILSMSYKELPVHLKPCFLHMGVFPEDFEIKVSQLIKMWVAEGFLKPSIDDKSLEVVAEEYLKELIDRNLIVVHKSGWNGKVRLCKLHDLLRDLCLREAQRQRFLCVLRQQDPNIPQGINMERRICIHDDGFFKYSPRILHAVESASLARSLFSIRGFSEASLSNSSRLLRVYSTFGGTSILEEAIFQLANLRYLTLEPISNILPSSLYLIWNLQTLSVDVYDDRPIIKEFEIWKMPQLRHVMLPGGIELVDPPSQEDYVLENLDTLSAIHNFKCGEEVVKRIPNIKKLKLYYDTFEEEVLPNYCFNNLGRLQKLESLALELFRGYNDDDKEIGKSHFFQSLTVQLFLKKLTLLETNLSWDVLNTMIGLLPLLEVLKLKRNSCIGPKWETSEGQFGSLKFLLIEHCLDLEYWTTDNTHFPLLEHLRLQDLDKLKEIPSVIGELPVLRSFHLEYCSKSLLESAERIKEEQEELGNASLKFHIVDWRTQPQPDTRQRIVNKIMETLKRNPPLSGQEGLQELEKKAVRIEEETYVASRSQADYLRQISLKMLTMETKSYNLVDLDACCKTLI